MKFSKLQKAVNENGIECFADTSSCIEHGWDDWFCSNEALKNRTKPFLSLIKGIKEGGKIDFEWNAWFKNNYPCAYDKTYDQIRFSSEERNEYVIGYHEPFKDVCGKTWAVYVPDNGYETPILFDNVRQLVKWLNEN